MPRYEFLMMLGIGMPTSISKQTLRTLLCRPSSRQLMSTLSQNIFRYLYDVRKRKRRATTRATLYLFQSKLPYGTLASKKVSFDNE